MAKRVARKQPAPDAGAEDLDILHPERSFQLAGRAITMREYGFVEGLRLMPLLEPIIHDLRRIMEGEQPLPGIEQVPAVLGDHAEALVELMAIAADLEPDWIAALKADDGHELLWWWWLVNGPFCVRSASKRAQLAREVAAQTKALRAGATSTPPSSPTATATPPPSAD